MLIWSYYVLLLILHVIGWSLNLLGLPGLWLMVIAHIVYAWATGWDFYTGLWASISLLLLAVLAEIVEFVAGAAGSKSAGGTKRGMVGAIVGGLLGGIFGSVLIPIPIVGTVFGAVAGSAAGAFSIEKLIHPDTNRALRISYGAAKGRFLGIVIKGSIGLIMAIVSLITALPIGSPPPVIPASQPSQLPATQPMQPPIDVPATVPATMPSMQP